MNIDKSIPVPENAGRIGGIKKYPFADMQVGDSVFFAGEKIGRRCNPYLAAQQVAIRHGMKFCGRSIDGGVRIWRIE